MSENDKQNILSFQRYDMFRDFPKNYKSDNPFSFMMGWDDD